VIDEEYKNIFLKDFKNSKKENLSFEHNNTLSEVIFENQTFLINNFCHQFPPPKTSIRPNNKSVDESVQMEDRKDV